MLSHTLKQRFVRDNNLSINILDDPYFTERVKILGKEKELKSLEELITVVFDGNEEKYLEAYNLVKDKAIDFIKESEAFKHLNDSKRKFERDASKNIPEGDIYKEPFIGKTFLSIDLRKANFSALVFYAKSHNLKFFDSYNYEDFIGKFTNIDEIKNSKYIRQVIFGNCNPKRVIQYEKVITTYILERILESTTLPLDKVIKLCNDEIIIDCNDLETSKLLEIKKVIDEINENVIPIHYEYFTLGKVVGSDAYIKKIYKDFEYKKAYEYDVKCAHPDDIIFILKMLNGIEFSENDLVFYNNKKLAKYLEFPKFEITFELK